MLRLASRKLPLTSRGIVGRNFHFSLRRLNKNIPEYEIISEREKLSKLRKVEVIQGLLQGTGLLVILIGGFMIFSDYNNYKHRFLNFVGLDDKSSKTIEDKTVTKPKHLEYFTFPNNGKYSLLNSESNPGVYLWGSNADGVVNPSDLKQRTYKFPIRLPFFDNMVLKDMKINYKLIDGRDDLNLYLKDNNKKEITVPDADKASIQANENTGFGYSSAFAIDSCGDLIQWGKGFNQDDPTPKYTLKGHKLIRGEFTKDKIYLLNEKNELIWIPINEKKQSLEITKRNWLLQKITEVDKVEALPNNEKIVDFDTGISHLVILSDKQKAYVAATTKSCKNFGQFGLLDYSKGNDIPETNKLHELFLLNNELIIPRNDKSNKLNARNTQIIPRKIIQIAVGNYHTLARDSIGNVYGFGKNTYGQLGIPVTYASEKVATPKKVEFFTKYFNAFNTFPVAIDIKASSHSSYATIITKNLQEVFQKNIEHSDLFQKSDYDDLFYFAMGKGLYGQLGVGYYIHANSIPKKMASLVHDMAEYNEYTKTMHRTLISKWSIGKNHCFITMENSDVLGFGGNKFGQLGTGKYVNISTPSNILKIIEPEDVSSSALDRTINVDEYQKKINNRLHLINHKEFKYINDKNKKSKDTLSQVVVAGNDNSAIYYVSD